MNETTDNLEIKSPARVIRYSILVGLLLIGLYILFKQTDHFRANDYTRYWLSSLVLLSGGDPYNSTGVLPAQEEKDLSLEQSCITYNPPWTLPLLVPFGLISRPAGQMLWLLIQISAILLCASYIWRQYGGKKQHQWLAWLISFTFGPVVAAVVLQGQITPIILLGLVGFIFFHDRQNKGWLAGISLVLASIKPQLLTLFFIAFILWALFNKQWSPLIGLASITLLLHLLIFVMDPHIYSQYFQCLREKGPAVWANPSLGNYLRLLFKSSNFLLQFLPQVLGVIWVVLHWIRHRHAWLWVNELPLILFVSTISSTYIWTYDMVILLLPVLLAFIWLVGERRYWMLAILTVVYLGINFLYLKLHLSMDDSKFFWLAPALFLWFFFVLIVHRKSENITLLGERA